MNLGKCNCSKDKIKVRDTKNSYFNQIEECAHVIVKEKLWWKELAVSLFT
jgi:hypothetical protein